MFYYCSMISSLNVAMSRSLRHEGKARKANKSVHKNTSLNREQSRHVESLSIIYLECLRCVFLLKIRKYCSRLWPVLYVFITRINTQVPEKKIIASSTKTNISRPGTRFKKFLLQVEIVVVVYLGLLSEYR